MWKFPFYEVGQAIDWAALENHFDWFSEMKSVEQDKYWHGEGNVYNHTKMVVEALITLPEFQALDEQKKHILFATAMFHDIEKRSTSKVEIIDGVERITSARHALKGEYTTRSILYKDIPTPFQIREQIAKLVRYHGLPIWALEKPDPRKSVIEVSLLLNTHLLAIFAKADMLGRICLDKEEMLLRIELFKELCKEHNCYGIPYPFKSDHGRFLFLTKPEMSPDYEPYNDLKFDVYMMSALPGSGKDTYIKKNLELPVLSLDDLRREHGIKPIDRKGGGQIIQMAKEKAKVYMRKRQSFVFNATNLTSDLRKKWIDIFTDYGGCVKIIYIEVPYKKLLAQNHNRSYKVPEKVIHKMLSKLEIPSYKEAHQVKYEVI